MVAVVALRVDWLRFLRYLHLHDRTHRRNLSHTFSRRQ